MCIQKSDNQIKNQTQNQTQINQSNKNNLELTMVINKTIFKSGEKVLSTITLKNIGTIPINILYFPNMPFNAFLYDENGNLLDTYIGNVSPSTKLVKSDILVLESESEFSKQLNFTVDRPPGKYQLDAGFIGNIENLDNNSINKILVMSKKIFITIV
jgi:hypothetical protein